ncbi:hypothetical protein [Halogeometricum limi]|uniref:Uncharacterized protein n=1 Tax=Halogeometricum limi TaxID=555875 RepID=A0A1I6FVL4_9EURY|nr:hypothetical protein [Halogeometricum limi]SFR33992.1 hypothetical protein SAMN04488124_0389 [Halogeometricum limi]
MPSSSLGQPAQSGGHDRRRRVVYATFWGVFGVSFVALGIARGLTLLGLASGLVGVGGFVLTLYSLSAPARALPAPGVFSRRVAPDADGDSFGVAAAYALAVVLGALAVVLLAVLLLV